MSDVGTHYLPNRSIFCLYWLSRFSQADRSVRWPWQQLSTVSLTNAVKIVVWAEGVCGEEGDWILEHRAASGETWKGKKNHQQRNDVVWQELGAVWTRSLWAGQGMGAFESGHADSREWVESVQSWSMGNYGSFLGHRWRELSPCSGLVWNRWADWTLRMEVGSKKA